MKQSILRNFYVLEGIDGSGTTTQLNSLKKMAEKENLPLHATFEPSDSPIGRTIRTILRGEYQTSQETIARLFSADRCDHLYNRTSGIETWLQNGYKVLSDRYLFSSLVYQSIDYSLEEVLKLNPFPLPEILFYIDTHPSIGIERRSQRSIEEIYEKESLQMTIYNKYEAILEKFARSDMKIRRIDGSLPPEEISARIWREMTDLPKL